jgi:ribosomal protein L11 methyltransferase
MNLQYLALTFEMGHHDHEIWQALLSEWPFESFHDEGDEIVGYIQDHDITSGLLDFISTNKGQYFSDYHLEQVPDKNWNEVWESSFNPVAVDDYCYIRAEFHKPVIEKYKHVITISPKMAFGTGHHATTYMMIRAMSQIDFQGKSVLDFGCGTGILAILAAKEGAAKVIGVDIQPEAIENSYEHAEMNGIAEVCDFYLGGLEKAGDEKYDVILANINRNVILENLPALANLIVEKGNLLISGIMFDDEAMIREALNKENFIVLHKEDKDQWVCIKTVKQ